MTTVLVVDDDPAQQLLFSLLLNRTGFDTVTAQSAFEALNILAYDNRFDVVLTDLRMPMMSGVDFAREVQHQFPNLPVVLMSVRPEAHWDDDMPMLGVAFLQKPFNRDQLLYAMRYAMGQNQALC